MGGSGQAKEPCFSGLEGGLPVWGEEQRLLKLDEDYVGHTGHDTGLGYHPRHKGNPGTCAKQKTR